MEIKRDYELPVGIEFESNDLEGVDVKNMSICGVKIPYELQAKIQDWLWMECEISLLVEGICEAKERKDAELFEKAGELAEDRAA